MGGRSSMAGAHCPDAGVGEALARASPVARLHPLLLPRREDACTLGARRGNGLRLERGCRAWACAAATMVCALAWPSLADWLRGHRRSLSGSD